MTVEQLTLLATPTPTADELYAAIVANDPPPPVPGAWCGPGTHSRWVYDQWTKRNRAAIAAWYAAHRREQA